MSNTIVEWVVEEVKKDGNVKKSKFSSYDEALDIYENLKTQNPESFISIQKSEKKLLVE